ncbi:hypothetical protein BJ170DRAFT_686549 [Xylariales sp. AK1849]|nr:hypothetical protein BJ170DRAFT_686549 [Xylariales sp. AK1849]
MAEYTQEVTYVNGDEDIELRDMTTWSRNSPRDTAMPDADAVLATPQQSSDSGFLVLPSGPLTSSYPNTRSHARLRPAPDLKGPRPTGLLSRLQSASARSTKERATSRLEDAREIRYMGGEEGQAEGDDDEEGGANEVEDQRQGIRELKASRRASSLRPDIGQLRVIRRSARIKSRDEIKPDVVAGGDPSKKRATKKQKTQQHVQLPLRRSARLAKPLTKFHKYCDLPPELKIIAWEAAVNPRLVYIRNRAAPNPSYIVQNKQPTWFMANRISVEVAKKSYRKMFGLHTPVDVRTRQDVNPDVDIIALEPCCNGCRGLYCTRHQFTADDRAAVRFLAIQTDSPYLLPTAAPCWVTISTSWPSVETLYLMKIAIKGDLPAEKAIIRMEETDRETDLRKSFDAWKKDLGKDKTVTNLEFVVIVDRETEPKNSMDRYKGVEERKTGLPEDIILG